MTDFLEDKVRQGLILVAVDARQGLINVAVDDVEGGFHMGEA